MSHGSDNLDKIFWEASQIASSEDRQEYLDRACAGDNELRQRIDSLLRASSKAEGFLERPYARHAARLDSDIALPGTRIGPYTLLEEIGEGGMGVVFMARKEGEEDQVVALKLIRPGMDSRQVVQRFEAERQALARMDHHHIARVLDAGSTESGRPYFVMDLVTGIPVTDYCDEKRLSTRDRLRLVVTICLAVQHAHQKGVIHRDLKPNNVLVSIQDGKPIPRVIDFGIAKATQGQLADETLTGCAQMLGTPLYMSPEQAAINETDVDTRSDVYSLGVLLYELLAGTTPFDPQLIRDASFDELRRIIREDEPERPSTRLNLMSETRETVAEKRGTDFRTLSQQLSGELDWIVMKALDKDPARRYESAGAVARDIERFLRNEPVEACPPSAMYRFRKFARRNRLVLASTTLVMLSLAAGVGIATWQSIQAIRERDKTEVARAESEELATLGLQVLDDIYLDVLGDRLARQPEVSTKQRRLLKTGLDYYERFVSRSKYRSDSDRVIGDAHRQIGLIYGRLGDRQREASAYRQAISSYERLAEQSPNVPEIQFRLALVLGGLLENQAALGQIEQAKESGVRAIQVLERLRSLYPDEPDYGMALAGTHNRLAWALAGVLSPRDIERHHRTAIRLFDGLAGTSPGARLEGELPYDDPLDGGAHSRLHLAQVVRDTEATSQLQLAALQHFQAKVASNPRSQWHRAQLADISLTLSGENVRRGVDLLEELHSEFPSVPRHKFRLASACERLGHVLEQSGGQVEEAEQYLRRAVQLLTELVRDYPNTPDYQSHLAAALGGLLDLPRTVVDLDEARQLVELAITRQTEAVKANPEHREYRKHLADHFGSLALVLEKLGENEDTSQAYVRRTELMSELADEDSETFEMELFWSRLAYADWLTRHGDYEDAAELYGELITACSTESDVADPDRISLLGASLHGLGNVQLASDQLVQAQESFQQAVRHQESLLPAHPHQSRYKELLCRHLCRLGTVQNRLGQTVPARVALDSAIEMYRDLRGKPDAAVDDDVARTLVAEPRVLDAPTIMSLAGDALQRSPYSPAMWMAQGVAQCRSGKWTEAVDALSRAHQLGGENGTVYLFMAMATWEIGERQESFDWYQQAIERQTTHNIDRYEFRTLREEADAQIGPAIAIHRAGRLDDTGAGITIFAFAVTRFGDISSSVTVDWATSDGSAQAGRDYVPAAGQLDFGGGDTQQRITVSVYQDLVREGAEDFMVSLVDVAGATVAQRRAFGTIPGDEATDSIDKWNTAIRTSPDSAVSHFKRGVARQRESGGDDESSADFSRAIELDPNFAQAYFNRSLLLQKRGESHQALDDLQQAIQLGLRPARVFNNRGVIRVATGDSQAEAALADFNRAIELGPPRAEFHNNRGVVHVSRGELDEAITDFDEAIGIYPGLAVAYANRAITLARLGLLDQALADVRQMLEQEWPPADGADAVEWMDVAEPEQDTLSRLRDEAARLIPSIEQDSPENTGTSDTPNKVAGEPTLRTKELTGPASLRRLVCTPGKMSLAILSQTADLTKQEHQAMAIAQMKKRLQDRHRQLRLETLEQRNLLTTGSISGTVFEDADGDGAQGPSETGLPGWTVVLDRTDTPDLQNTLVSPSPEAGERFGDALAMLGNQLLVGAYQNDSGAADAGVAYLLDAETGQVTHSFVNPTPDVGDWFGHSVATLGGDVLVGAQKDDTGAEDAGAVYLFDGANNWALTTFLNPAPTAFHDNFGHGIAAFGDNVLIAAAGTGRAGADNVGVVYLFNKTGDLIQTFENPTPAANDYFGAGPHAIVGVGDNVLVGANLDDVAGEDAGAAYLLDPETAEVVWTFTDPTPNAGDHFGATVEVLDGNILIGEFNGDADATNAGAVHLFDGTTHQHLLTFESPNPSPGDHFGRSITVVGTNVVVSARKDDTGAADAGTVYVFNGSTGELAQTIVNPSLGQEDLFGSALTTSGDSVIIGCPNHDTGWQDAGAVYVFDTVEVSSTDAVGNYTFPSLEEGTYQVSQIVQPNYIPVAPVGNGSHEVDLAAGQEASNLNFGNQFRPILFSDGFESGQDQWVEDSQDDWFVSTQRAKDGGYSAEVDGRATDAELAVANPIDVTLYGSAELSFDWFMESGLDTGEYLALDLYDGSDWNEEALLSGNVDPENTWQYVTIDVDGRYLVSNFQFRFRAKMSGSREDANVDNVTLVATSLAGPANVDPVADAGGAYPGTEDAVVTFDGSGSSDPDGAVVEYMWDFGDGTSPITTSSPTITHTYAWGDSFDVMLTVTDDRGGTATDTTTATITEVNDKPVAYPGGPYGGAINVNISFDGSGSSDDDNLDGTGANDQPLTYTWDFGDGSDPVTTSNSAINHTYGATDTYTATLTVNDGVEDSDVQTTQVVVTAAQETMHVGDLGGTANSINKKKWAANVTVLVLNAVGDPVPNATVQGTWSTGIVSTASTNSSGLVTVTSGTVSKSINPVMFTVDSVTETSLTYVPDDNTDIEGDSNGTAILVYQDGSTAPPASLRVASGASSSLAGGNLTQNEAEAAVTNATSMWSWQTETMPQVNIADLPAGTLGWAFGDTITLDINANGAGWYTDLNAPVGGQFDLLTVVSHEIGHLMGYGHSEHHEDLMVATLPVGVRRLPGTAQVTTHAPLASMLVSPLLLPESFLSAKHSELVEDTILTSDLEGDIENVFLPLVPADHIDRPQSSPTAIDVRLLNDIADEETELMGDELLDLIVTLQK